MKYEVLHTNTFHYETQVEQSLNTFRLKPRNDEFQRLFSYENIILPASMTKEHLDIWGNNVESFFIPEKHQILKVETKSIVSVQKIPFIHFVKYTKEMQDIYHSQLFHEHYLPYLSTSSYTFLNPKQISEVLFEIGNVENPLEFALRVMQYLYEVFTYDIESTTVETKAVEVFTLKKGVCQDYSHVMLGILRSQGIPARYVSGYLYVGENSDLVGDSASHAWVELMVPGVGWIGLDPTNHVEVLNNHIKLSVGRDYTDVSPLQGVYHGGNHTLEVKVEVRKLE